MRILLHIAISVAVLVGAAAGARAGQEPAGSSPEEASSVSGRVTIEARGAPGIVVALQQATSSRPLPAPVARATTDPEGRFKLTNVAAGRYYLVPLAPAYFAPSEDRMVASGKPVTLMKGENLDGIELALTPGGVITGRVTTAGGWPLIGREVYAILTDLRVMQSLPATRDGASAFKTDDRGVYRIYGLPAGRYIVSVQRDQNSPTSVENFSLGVTAKSQARTFEVTAGMVVENVDIKLAPIMRAFDVSGRVVDEATGQPISKIRVGRSALDASGKSVIVNLGGPPVNERGEFRFTGLLPGRYSVYMPIDSGSEYYSDQVFFEVVDQDVTGVEIKARRAASLSGRVVIEGARDPAVLSDLSHLHVWVSRLAGGDGAGVLVGADGRFRIPGLPPDKFKFHLNSRTQRQRFALLGVERDGVWQLESTEVADGEQVTGLRVIVAYGAGVVRGQAQVINGTLPEGARWTVFARRAGVPGQPSSAQPVSVDAQGRFLLEGLATGAHEISLSVYVPSPSGSVAPFRRWALVKQTITVTSGAESQVTLIVDASAHNGKEQKQ